MDFESPKLNMEAGDNKSETSEDVTADSENTTESHVGKYEVVSSPEKILDEKRTEEENSKKIQEIRAKIKSLEDRSADEVSPSAGDSKSFSEENKIEGADRWVRLESHEFNPNNFYRIVGDDGYRDFIEKGYLRSSPTGTESRMVGKLNIGNRPTSFPSFSKGAPDKSYFKNDGDSYIFETDTVLFGRGEKNPVTGTEVGIGPEDGGSRHWAYRLIDAQTGKVVTKMPAELIKDIYKVDKDGNLYLKKNISMTDKAGETKDN